MTPTTIATTASTEAADWIFIGTILDADDKLAVATAEVKRLTLVQAALRSRIEGLVHEEEAAKRAIQYWQRKYDQVVLRGAA